MLNFIDFSVNVSVEIRVIFKCLVLLISCLVSPNLVCCIKQNLNVLLSVSDSVLFRCTFQYSATVSNGFTS